VNEMNPDKNKLCYFWKLIQMINKRISKKREFPTLRFIFITMGTGITLFRFYAEIEPEKMEYGYSRAIYLFIADIFSLAGKSVPVPYSASELFIYLIIISMLIWGCAAVFKTVIRLRAGDESKKWIFFRLLLNSTLNITAILAGGYFFFLSVWGFNYLRQPFFVSFNKNIPIVLEPSDYDNLAEDMVALANRFYRIEKNPPNMIDIQKIDEAVDRAVIKVVEKISHSGIPTPPPIKFLLSNSLLNMLGVSGLFLPIFMEPHINSNLILWEMPVTIAHEKAHFMGFASETDANLIAYIACLGSDTDILKYSASLEIIISLYPYLSQEKWQMIVKESLSQPVQNDIKARRERIQHCQERYSWLSRVSRESYNTYLKLNSQKTGIDSYHESLPQLAIWWKKFALNVR